MSAGRHAVPAEVMERIRLALPVPEWSSSRHVTQSRAAHYLGTTERAVRRWERNGTENGVPALAYVGRAFELAGPDAARAVLKAYRQAELGV